MKKILAIALLCLFPFKVVAFELTMSVDFNGMFQGSKGGDIMKIAMDYDGYNANKNRKELKQLLDVDPVQVPWCAGFINFVLEKAGYYSTDNLSAASYHNYGMKVNQPQPGDIVLVKRTGGSGRHVAFFHSYYTENGVKYIQLLGGNQDKSVNITAYPVDLVVEIRRPIKKFG
jgi:uncharacterized protein (TIGR02594 family)